MSATPIVLVFTPLGWRPLTESGVPRTAGRESDRQCARSGEGRRPSISSTTTLHASTRKARFDPGDDPRGGARDVRARGIDLDGLGAGFGGPVVFSSRARWRKGHGEPIEKKEGGGRSLGGRGRRRIHLTAASRGRGGEGGARKGASSGGGLAGGSGLPVGSPGKTSTRVRRPAYGGGLVIQPPTSADERS